MDHTKTSPPPAVLIASDLFRGHHYGPNHPLNIPRVPLTVDLINAYGPLPSEAYMEARPASDEELCGFHRPDYITALKQSQAVGRIESAHRQRFNIGNFENPFFNNFFTIPALAAGGSCQAAEQVVAGRTAFNPAGGMHHAAPGKARGFCFINDAVLAIRRLRRQGWRVLYLDLDAHHGDGVQHAVANDVDVATVSFHMDTAYAYPRRGGGIEESGPLGTALNLPLPRATNDSEYRLAFDTLWPEIVSRFKPEAVVLQTGTDILAHDPLGKLNISNRLFLEVVSRVRNSTPGHASGIPRLAVLGGGGYHPLALARCWTGVWAILTQQDLPDELPGNGRRLLQNVQRQGAAEDPRDADLIHRRYDRPLEGKVRDEVKLNIDRLLQHHPLFQSGG